MIYLLLLINLVSIGISGFVLLRLLPVKTKKMGSAVLLDTSALMDGRIKEVVRSGFVPAALLIPRFVVAELQLLADKADHLKRERARFGLQTIQDLQDNRQAEVSIIGDEVQNGKDVDDKLVKLALKRGALLFTTDFNLLKVAEIEGVRVLNINELAQNLRPTHLPGETAQLKIVQRGQERTQGVGYLEDGTMVVVENSAKLHGKLVSVEFTRTLQTAAGRMMFARMISRSRNSKPKNTFRRTSAEDKLLGAIDQQHTSP